ncbi:MAG: hypothetical protein FWG53_05605 [Clostridiales bacterium]|nr:hypothetical protein [Clostridiales bacterium]
MAVVEFFPADNTDGWDIGNRDMSLELVLEQIGENLRYPVGMSQVNTEGVVHFISNDSIIIIKRNEKRFWTRSLAREDAEIALFKRLNETEPSFGSICKNLDFVQKPA